MQPHFMIYGSYGFVGKETTKMAVENGLRPLLAGRDREKLSAQAAELDLDYRAFELDDQPALEAALNQVPVVLHMAGPFIYTAKAMARACLHTGTHYVDISGELPVYSWLADQNAAAKEQGVMLLTGAGFDVAATDCLALYLKETFPTATHLTLAFQSHGPAGIPKGTAKTMIESAPAGTKVRRNGKLESAPFGKTRKIDFGNGSRDALQLSWGDVFTAYFSTGIPNIENYAAVSPRLIRQLGSLNILRPLLKIKAIREVLKPLVPAGSTAEERAKTQTHVWGQVRDDEGNTATARVHGPEAGVVWTSLAALDGVQQILDGKAKPGFQTPARAFGADFGLQHDNIWREELNT